MLAETLQILKDYSATHEAVAVAYSDGKDSRVVMDLCMRSFKRVEAFYMFLVPGLECIEIPLAAAEKRWGIKIRRYPHWVTARLIRDGTYCNPKWTRDDMPDFKLHDVYALAMHDCRAGIIATGAKKADSAWRRRFMSVKWAELVQPIAEWNKFDVLSYLKMRNIPVPLTHEGNATGIDLSSQAILWLYDTYLGDYQKIREFFPFVEAVVWRRKFYGK